MGFELAVPLQVIICLACADDTCVYGFAECVITEFAVCYLLVKVTCSLLKDEHAKGVIGLLLHFVVSTVKDLS